MIVTNLTISDYDESINSRKDKQLATFLDEMKNLLELLEKDLEDQKVDEQLLIKQYVENVNAWYATYYNN